MTDVEIGVERGWAVHPIFKFPFHRGQCRVCADYGAHTGKMEIGDAAKVVEDIARLWGQQRYEQPKQEDGQWRENGRLKDENEGLREKNEQLREEKQRLKDENKQLREDNERLREHEASWLEIDLAGYATIILKRSADRGADVNANLQNIVDKGNLFILGIQVFGLQLILFLFQTHRMAPRSYTMRRSRPFERGRNVQQPPNISFASFVPPSVSWKDTWKN